jgi:hypothetical protein
MRRLLLLSHLLLLAGCLSAAGRTIPDSAVDLFGVRMGSTVQYRVLGGVTGSDEPCLHGYDRTFEELEVVVGYDRHDRVRKVVTRNPATAILGIRPGDPLDRAVAMATAAGFIPAGSDRTFTAGPFLLTLRDDGHRRVAGITLETRP